MSKIPTLRELINRARYRGATVPPLPMAALAASCGLARAHLYKMMNSELVPQEHTRNKLARGLAERLRGKVSLRTIHRSIEVAAELAKVSD